MILVVIAGGCDFNNRITSIITPTMHEVNTEASLAPTPTLHRTLEPTRTPYLEIFYPTLIPEQEEVLKTILLDTNCTLPCYLGIIPGVTTKYEAEKRITELGGIKGIRSNLEDRRILSRYYLIPGVSPKGRDYENTSKQYWNALFGIFHVVDVISIGDEVEGLIVGMSSANSIEEYQKALNYWQNFSVMGVLSLLGLPDRIYIENSSSQVQFISVLDIVLDYSSKGIIINISGENATNNICIENPALIFDFVFADVAYSKSGELFKPPFIDSIFPKKRTYLPIEEILGITPEEFYNKVMANPSACFDIKE